MQSSPTTSPPIAPLLIPASILLLLGLLPFSAPGQVPTPGEQTVAEYFPDGSQFARGQVIRDRAGDERLEGEWTFWYATGKVQAVGSYRDGKKAGPRGGSGVPVAGREGVWTFWYESGQKRQEVEYAEGSENGRFLSWYSDGQPEAQGTYVRGRKQGRWTLWHPNGARKFSGVFAVGREEGPVVFWHDNGQKMLQGGFRNGEREGRFVSWDANGMRRAEGDYRADGKDGVWTYWDEKGRQVKTEIYHQGVLIREKISDQPSISGRSNPEG